jgi:uncharacterized membrane protein YuzA (DUF378 family)
VSIPRLEEGAAFAVVGLAVINTINLYRDAAPKLSDLRMTHRDDYQCRQLMMDADFFGGLSVAMIGGTAAVLTRRIYPLVIAAAGLLLVSLYYRSVLKGPSPSEILENNE